MARSQRHVEADALNEKLRRVTAEVNKVKLRAPKLTIVEDPPPARHTPASVRESMREARRTLKVREAELRALQRRADKMDRVADPVAWMELMATIGVRTMSIGDVLLAAVYGSHQAKLLKNESVHKLLRSEAAKGLSEKYRDGVGYVPSANPWEAASRLNAWTGLSARTNEELAALALELAPVGSRWHCQNGLTGKVVEHRAGGSVYVDFERDKKRCGFGVDDFSAGAQEDRWFDQRLDTPELDGQALAAIPVGSRWRHGSHTYLVENNDELSDIRLRHTRTGRRAHENIWGFFGPGAYFVRVDEAVRAHG